ncbi:MAG: hypothetical protein AAGF12_24520 [Myxococcota bacterium]
MRGWAFAQDNESLQAVAKHRDALLELVSVEAALALGRLIDLEGAATPIVEALATAEARAEGSDRARLLLFLAQAAFEAGRIGEARDRLTALAESSESEQISVMARFHLVRLTLIANEGQASERLDHARRAYAKHQGRWPWVDSLAAASEAAVALADGRRRQAQLLYERAFDIALTYDGSIEGAVVAGLLGNVEFDLEHYASAHRWFETAIELANRAGSRSVAATFVGYRAWTLAHLGKSRRAREVYAEAVRTCRELGVSRFESQFAALRTVVDVTERNCERREVEFRRALATLTATGDSARADGLRILQVVFDVARANAATSSTERQRKLIGAYGRLRVADERSDDARLAKRMAERAFEAALELPASVELQIRPGGQSGRGPMGDFDFSRHSNLAGLLWALVEAWADRRVASPDELIAAVWPGEKLLESAARHRLQVAISSVRKRALGDLLARDETGYWLASDVSLARPEDLQASD